MNTQWFNHTLLMFTRSSLIVLHNTALQNNTSLVTSGAERRTPETKVLGGAGGLAHMKPFRSLTVTLSLQHLLALQPQHCCDITWNSEYRELLSKKSYQTFGNKSEGGHLIKPLLFSADVYIKTAMFYYTNVGMSTQLFVSFQVNLVICATRKHYALQTSLS